jgi:hypothetical protein
MVTATSSTDGKELVEASTDLLLDGTVVERLDSAIGGTAGEGGAGSVSPRTQTAIAVQVHRDTKHAAC